MSVSLLFSTGTDMTILQVLKEVGRREKSIRRGLAENPKITNSGLAVDSQGIHRRVKENP